jgi:hypothetical protein
VDSELRNVLRVSCDVYDNDSGDNKKLVLQCLLSSAMDGNFDGNWISESFQELHLSLLAWNPLKYCEYLHKFERTDVDILSDKGHF